MLAKLHKQLSILVVSLLVLSCLSSSTSQLASSQVQSPSIDRAGQRAMPAGLMNAFLEASAQPFEFTADGYIAHSGGMEFTLGASGLQAGAPGFSWGLSLRGIGRGDLFIAAPPAVAAQSGARLEYQRGVLTEWYRDTALGMEQGFTIYFAPPGADPLSVQLALSSDLRVTPDGDAGGLSFVTPSGQTLRYDKVRAWDAHGIELKTVLLCHDGVVKIQVNDQQAVYPITVDPLVYLEQKVIASGAANSWFGYSVALAWSPESIATALVGAPMDDVGPNEGQGSAFVFIQNGDAWSLERKLIASDGAAGDHFGYTVALEGSASGENLALVGAFYDDVGENTNQGSAYIFTRSGTTWSEQARLTASDGAAWDDFGSSVSLSISPLGVETALVGAYGKNVGGKAYQGSAYVFTRSGTTWSEQAKLVASDGAANDLFGDSTALEGDTALVGARADDIGANQDQGSAYIFVRSGTDWSEQARLFAEDGMAGDAFGDSVSLGATSDGAGMALVGASSAEIDGKAAQGSAYIFTRSGGSIWSLQKKLISPDGAGADQFGISVALLIDEVSGVDIALVGANYADVGINENQGCAYAFTRNGASWNIQQKLTTGDGAEVDIFGTSVVLAESPVGEVIALVGSPLDNAGETIDQGSAYVFTPDEMSWSQQSRFSASDGAANDAFGVSVALASTPTGVEMALVGADGDDVGSNVDQGSAYLFILSNGAWILQQRLFASDGAAGDSFGHSVALLSDIALVGAPGVDNGTNLNQGSVYVFNRNRTSWSELYKLTIYEGAAGDNFGVSIALSDTYALIGADGADIGGNVDQGSVYKYFHTIMSWYVSDPWIAVDGAAEDHFGYSLALTEYTALVGAPFHDVGANIDQGTAYFYTCDWDIWSQQFQFTASDGAPGDMFGVSVGLATSPSGPITALMGAPNADIGGNENQGAVYIFTGGRATWSDHIKLIASDGAAYDNFGQSIKLGLLPAGIARLLVGSPMDDIGENVDQGSAYLFIHDGLNWGEQAKLIAPDGAAQDFFASSVDLSNGRALVGAPKADIVGQADQGAVYLYKVLYKVYIPCLVKGES